MEQLPLNFYLQVNHGFGITTFRQVAVIVSHRRNHGRSLRIAEKQAIHRNITVNCPSRPAALPLQ